MNIIAADDEELALRALTRAIQEAVPEAEVHSFDEADNLIEEVRERGFRVDAAFLDIEMPGVNGLELAKKLKQTNPRTNIIFVTGFHDYMGDAFRMHASGYLVKPVDAEDVRKEMENLRHPIVISSEKCITARCFGNFEVFVDGKILHFARSKTKEMFAYLIDRRGSSVNSGELRAVLWEDASNDENTSHYLQKLKTDMNNTLKEYGLQKAFISAWNKYAIDTSYISCDYYDFMDDKPEGIRAYNGEYMTQYSWGEFELGKMLR